MVSLAEIDLILDSNPRFKNHFILKLLHFKREEFLFIALTEESSGKDLESIIVLLGELFDNIEELKVKNIAFSFKEIEYFGDLGLALMVRLSSHVVEICGMFVVIDPKPGVKNVIEILGLDECWSIYNSMKELNDDINNKFGSIKF